MESTNQQELPNQRGDATDENQAVRNEENLAEMVHQQQVEDG